MPYVSYEEFERQQTVAGLIKSTFEEYEALERLNDITNTDNHFSKAIAISNSKNKGSGYIEKGDQTIKGPLGGNVRLADSLDPETGIQCIVEYADINLQSDII
jgi:hypothetical protein